METMINNKAKLDLSTETLASNINKAIEMYTEISVIKDYRIRVKADLADWKVLTEEIKAPFVLKELIFNNNQTLLSEAIMQLSKNDRKRLYKFLNKVTLFPTLGKFNKLISFLKRRVVKNANITQIQVLVSSKEEKIQEARYKYVQLRNEAKAAYKTYKEEKGDFYKQKSN